MRGSYYSGGRTNRGGRSNRGSTVYLIVYFEYISAKFQRLLQDVRLKAVCFRDLEKKIMK